MKRSPKLPVLRPSANNLTSAADSPNVPSPGLTANFPSNNPFRNRAASPANSLPSPVTNTFNYIPNTAPERPISRNPFIDQFDQKDATTVQVRQTSQEKVPSTGTMAGKSSPRKLELTGHAVELFVSRPLPICTPVKSGDTDSVSARTNSRSMMGLTSRSMLGLRPTARHQKACLHRIPIVPHDQKTTPPSLRMAYWDIIHHDHRRMENIDHILEEDFKRHRRISSPIHQKREDRTDVQPDEIQIHQSPVST